MDKDEINDKINNLLGDDDKKELIEYSGTCNNFWCKCQYKVKIYVGDDTPKTCPKCDSFNYELSDGVESKDIQYDGLRYDGKAHETSFKFSKYKSGKGFWNK